jgi:hypothetical protein
MTAMETQMSRFSEQGGRREYPERRLTPARRHQGDNSGMLLAGLAVVGLGALAWYYLGPDLMRYIRIETM